MRWLRSVRAAVGALALIFFAAPFGASALDFGAGPSPRAYEPGAFFSIKGDEAVIVEGVNSSGKPTKLFLRVDDEWGPAAEQRHEVGFDIPAGRFSVFAPVEKFIAKDGGALRLDRLTRVVVFSWNDAEVKITRFESGAKGSIARTPPPAAPDAAAEKTTPRRVGDALLDMMRPRPLPILFEPKKPADLSGASEIVIEGFYRGKDVAVLSLRVDDADRPATEDRFVGAYTIAPGAFQIVTPISALKTPAGRALDLAQIWRVKASSTDDRNFTVSRLEALAAPTKKAPAVKKTEATPKQPPKTTPRALKELDFGKGKAPIEHGYYFTTLDLGAYDEIIIEGNAKTKGGLWLILRIDDSKSANYATRFNLEIQLTEGPFKIRAPLGGLKSPSGRIIDPSDIKLLVAAPYGDKDGSIEITRFVAVPPATLPRGAIGFAFGSPEAGLPAGFKRIGPKHPGLFGSPVIVARPTPDPLVANGLGGVKVARLPVPAGAYRVTVWSEDPGAWEYLPHPLRRVIRVNGVVLRDDKQTPAEWLRRRYLRGLEREHTVKDDAYTAYGAHRGEPRTADVTVVGDEGLRIELGGDRPAARHISAVLVEPAGGDAAFKAVEAARADWYRARWRIDPSWRAFAAKDAGRAARLSIDGGTATLVDAAGAPISGIKATGAAGSGLRLTLEARSKVKLDAKARLIAPALGGARLSASLWAGQWRLERRRPSDTLLRLGDNTLSPTGVAPILPEQPRRYELWIEAPKGAKPGVYRGAVEVETKVGVFQVPVEIEILGVTLPEAAEPAGFYLSEAPHMTWFAAAPLARQRQAACDVRWVKRFGMLGSAPLVRAPKVGSTLATVLDLRLAFDLGLAPEPLAYNPIRPLQFDFKPAAGAKLIAEVEAQLKAVGAPTPYWSVADELSNPGDTAVKTFWPWVKALRAAAPGIKFAGHLNSPSDRDFLGAFDAVLLNPGFGIDSKTLKQMKGYGLTVWLYNTFEPRLTAGYWLWATDASRYVQWHARMPTADPFDPIDGREGDVQMILPSAEICPKQPGIHRDFLRLAEGVVDQRWLLWLEAQSTPEAEALKKALREQVANSGFKAVAAGGDAEMARIRAAIIALARR